MPETSFGIRRQPVRLESSYDMLSKTNDLLSKQVLGDSVVTETALVKSKPEMLRNHVNNLLSSETAS